MTGYGKRVNTANKRLQSGASADVELRAKLISRYYLGIGLNRGGIILNLTGAKEARSQIKKFHIALNQENIIPTQCFRRNHSNYAIITCTNHIIALFISSNYEIIPQIIGRLSVALERTDAQPVDIPYRNLVDDYLCQMSHFLLNYTTVDREKLQVYIPREILEAGSKHAPTFDPVTLKFKIGE